MKTMSEKSKQKMRETKLSNSKSFEQWCIENSRQDVLDRWDYELNGCSPKDVCYGTNKKYWFKCPTHPEHKSELKDIHSFTNGQEGSIKCNQCNSIAQWFIDNNLDIKDYWDYEKNGDLNPWAISRGSKKKIWIKCQEKDYHGSYEIICKNFTLNNARCPYCNNHHGLVHPKDSLGQKIVNKYGEQYLRNIWSDKNEKSPFEYYPQSNQKIWWKCNDNKHDDYMRTICDSVRYEFRCPQCSNERKCSFLQEKVDSYIKEKYGYKMLHEGYCNIIPINPQTNCPLPFDNEIEKLKLVIEVHGKQHYEITGFTYLTAEHYGTTAEEEFAYQIWKDDYKKKYALDNEYEYLEIPYWTENDESYKILIDNKINEILQEVV